MRERLGALWSDNRKLYGARKIWHALRREGVAVARCAAKASPSPAAPRRRRRRPLRREGVAVARCAAKASP
ncbi:MAG: IS3 family transposase, partial [Pseudomonadota bacterium]